MPCISIALLTGSVVVPGISDTRAVSCPVKALIKEDLPLFRNAKVRLYVGVVPSFKISVEVEQA